MTHYEFIATIVVGWYIMLGLFFAIVTVKGALNAARRAADDEFIKRIQEPTLFLFATVFLITFWPILVVYLGRLAIRAEDKPDA